MKYFFFAVWLGLGIGARISAASQGSYGPVYNEAGFHPNGGYFEMGFEAVVNHFGGNLVITSTDITIPSIGGFDLSVTRTYNSSRAYDAEFGQPIPDYDSPLGLGWTSHLGVLYPNAGTFPEWSDPSGARELFYAHDHLSGQIPISGSGGFAWISKSLKLLVPDGEDFLLYFPSGIPDVNRSVHTNGTIAWEMSDGVTKTYSWDDDFRLTRITHPDDDIQIAYTSNTVTKTQGDSWLRESYDGWGRLNQSEARVDGFGVVAKRISQYNGLGFLIEETVPAGAFYDYAHDVWGRNLTKTASNIQDSCQFSYQTGSQGESATIITRNNAKVTEIELDALGRILRGRVGGHVVNYSYSGNLQTISPVGQSSRRVKFDFLGRIDFEDHPETGMIDYSYDAAGRRTAVNKTLNDFSYFYDDANRLYQVRNGGTIVSERAYHATYGGLTSMTHGDVSVTHGNFDTMGRPREMVLTVPAGLKGPAMLWPLGDQLVSDIETNPRFEWDAVQSAIDYEIEVSGEGQQWRGATGATMISFTSLAFAPGLETVYGWRVRGRKNDEIGPWSPWVSLTVHGEPQIGLGDIESDCADRYRLAADRFRCLECRHGYAEL